MTKQEAIKILTVIRDEASESENAVCYVATEEDVEALDIAIKALQGDMYCPSCGVRLVPENEYVEPKPFEESDGE